MQISVNTDKTIERTAGLEDHVKEVVKAALHRFGEHIGRVDVHLSEGNAKKSSDGDIRCMIEARVNGYQPIAVTEHDATLHQSINGAADKLQRAIDSALGRLNDNKRHTTQPNFEEAEE
jgi:ribosomal subunit interface protein